MNVDFIEKQFRNANRSWKWNKIAVLLAFLALIPAYIVIVPILLPDGSGNKLNLASTTIQNSSNLTNIQSSSNVSINSDITNVNVANSPNSFVPVNSPNSSYNNIYPSENCPPYTQTLEMNLGKWFESANGYYPGLAYNLYNVKVIVLPTHQIFFMDKIMANTTYVPALMNAEKTDLCVYHKYRVPIDAKDICFIEIINWNETGFHGDTFIPSPKMFIDRESCYQKISGEVDIWQYLNPDKSKEEYTKYASFQ